MEGGANGDNGGVPNVAAQEAGVAGEPQDPLAAIKRGQTQRALEQGVQTMFRLKKREWTNLYNFEPDSFTQKLRAMA